MKWSLCSTGFKNRPVLEAAEVAAGLGLDGIELWTGHIEAYVRDGNTAEQLRERLSELGLAVPMISPYTYWTGSVEECERELEQLEQAMKWASALHCPMVRTFAGRVSSAAAEPKQLSQTIRNLQRALELADRHNVDLALEVHNDTFADRAGSIRSIIREAGHDRLKLIFDGFNLFVDGLDQMETFEELYEWTRHVHLKNYRWNRSDWGSSVPTSIFGGDVNQRELILRLKELRYDSFISFEYFGEQAEPCIRESIAEVRQLMGGTFN